MRSNLDEFQKLKWCAKTGTASGKKLGCSDHLAEATSPSLPNHSNPTCRRTCASIFERHASTLTVDTAGLCGINISPPGGFFIGFPSCAMASRDDKKRIEAITSAEDLPDLGKQDRTTAEKISAYFTIAAAAFGLISDGCESPCTTSNTLRLIIRTMAKIKTIL